MRIAVLFLQYIFGVKWCQVVLSGAGEHEMVSSDAKVVIYGSMNV